MEHQPLTEAATRQLLFMILLFAFAIGFAEWRMRRVATGRWLILATLWLVMTGFVMWELGQ